MRGAGAVLRRALTDERRAVLVWGAAMGAWGAFMAAIYPSIDDTVAELADQYPSALREAFAVGDIATVEGFIHAEMFTIVVPLAIGFFAVRAVTAAIAGAEEAGRLDTLLALPLPRRSLLLATFTAACAGAAAVLLACGALILATARIAGTGMDPVAMAAGVTGVWGIAVFAAGLAALACGALHRGRAATGAALGVLVAMYALDVAGRLSDAVEPLRWASAFRWYGAPLTDGLDWAGLAVLLAAGAFAAAAGARLFERRDVLA